ncbi:MAG: LamG domain-containing protein [Planctomycetaceae bacterium]|nr:LamG domain-containing protein [Planctomycetaceae bacterium]
MTCIPQTCVLAAVALLGAFIQLPAVAADESHTILQLDFGSEQSVQMTAVGNVQRDQPGPRPPEFPDFSEDNTAVRFDGTGARLVISDPGTSSAFDFTTGDTFTAEAWVFVQSIGNGQNMYIVGKGRTHSGEFHQDNQNWALRIVGDRSQGKLGFLFASSPESGAEHWHRWTSEMGFDPRTGWHHVAVQYTFGQPDSIRGWIDGRTTTGGWDLGGATSRPPVVDNDSIWIGSSMGGNTGNSMNGLIDEVVVHRGPVSEKEISSRFNRVGGPRIIGPLPEVMPEIADVPG